MDHVDQLIAAVQTATGKARTGSRDRRQGRDHRRLHGRRRRLQRLSQGIPQGGVMRVPLLPPLAAVLAFGLLPNEAPADRAAAV